MDKWYKKGANVRTNIAKYCIKNDPKLVPWRSRGLRRGIRATIGQSIRKRSRGTFLFLMAFGSPLGPWGAPKPPQPFLVNLFGSHFKPKVWKEASTKASQKLYRKNIEKNVERQPKSWQNGNSNLRLVMLLRKRRKLKICWFFQEKTCFGRGGKVSKSMKNVCKIDIGIRHGKMIQKGW